MTIAASRSQRGVHPRGTGANRIPSSVRPISRMQALFFMALTLGIAALGVSLCLAGLGILDPAALFRGGVVRAEALLARPSAPRSVPGDAKHEVVDVIQAQRGAKVRAVMDAVKHPLTAGTIKIRATIATHFAGAGAGDGCEGVGGDGTMVVEFSMRHHRAGTTGYALAETVVALVWAGVVDGSPITRLRNGAILELGVADASGVDSHIGIDSRSGALYLAPTEGDPSAATDVVLAATFDDAQRRCLSRIAREAAVGPAPLQLFASPPASVVTAGLYSLQQG